MSVQRPGWDPLGEPPVEPWTLSNILRGLLMLIPLFGYPIGVIMLLRAAIDAIDNWPEPWRILGDLGVTATLLPVAFIVFVVVWPKLERLYKA